MQRQKGQQTQECRQSVPEVWLTGQKPSPAISAQFPLETNLPELLEKE